MGEILTILGVGVGLAGLNLTSFRALRTELAGVRSEIGDLRERMARLEGLFEGFTKASPPT